MGVGRRLLDLARANLNAIMDRATRAELEGLSEAELQAELERRKQERVQQDEERARRVAAEAAARLRAEANARAPRDPRTRGASRRASEAEQRAARRLQLFRELGVKPGTPLDEIKRAYRALMREHHPDKHAGDAARQKAASHRAAIITTAYAELERLLLRK